jgi:hypothetical protein
MRNADTGSSRAVPQNATILCCHSQRLLETTTHPIEQHPIRQDSLSPWTNNPVVHRLPRLCAVQTPSSHQRNNANTNDNTPSSSPLHILPPQNLPLPLRQQPQHILPIHPAQVLERNLNQLPLLTHHLHNPRPHAAQIAINTALPITPSAPLHMSNIPIKSLENPLHALLRHLPKPLFLIQQRLDYHGVRDPLHLFDCEVFLLREGGKVDFLLEVGC